MWRREEEREQEREEEYRPHRSGRGGGHRGGSRRDHVVTSTVIIGVALFLLVGTPYLKHHMSTDGTLGNAIGQGDGPSDRDPDDRDARIDRDRRLDSEARPDLEDRADHDARIDRVAPPNRDTPPRHDLRANHDARPDHDVRADYDPHTDEDVRTDRDLHTDRETRPVRDAHVDHHALVDHNVRRTSNSDRDAVRHWLQENDDDPHPHEIRWWPARELTQLYKDRLKTGKEAAEDDPRLADQVQAFEDAGPDRVCRLKYRTRNAAHQDITRDDLFVIRDGKARLLAANSSLAIAARRSFPDGDGTP